ncbi:hypothetical protein HQ571_00700 [Candidatus Kuenenbacteria bacterium]|nr:hypothetical protein [Candidatus Kuenenbacteria bacterium]
MTDRNIHYLADRRRELLHAGKRTQWRRERAQDVAYLQRENLGLGPDALLIDPMPLTKQIAIAVFGVLLFAAIVALCNFLYVPVLTAQERPAKVELNLGSDQPVIEAELTQLRERMYRDYEGCMAYTIDAMEIHQTKHSLEFALRCWDLYADFLSNTAYERFAKSIGDACRSKIPDGLSINEYKKMTAKLGGKSFVLFNIQNDLMRIAGERREELRVRLEILETADK